VRCELGGRGGQGLRDPDRSQMAERKRKEAGAATQCGEGRGTRQGGGGLGSSRGGCQCVRGLSLLPKLLIAQ
jgi:hypothetical protein